MVKKKKKKIKPTEVKTEIEETVEAVAEPETVTVPTKVLKVDLETAKPKKSLDDRLLDYYHSAKVGSVTLEGLKRDLGANKEKLGQAWDRLYDAGLIEFSKFVKSCETYP